MFIPTLRTQDKLRVLFHEQYCADSDCTDLDDQKSRCYRRANGSAVLFLGKLMPVLSGEMFPAVRADERDKIAYHIRAELVCCDIHERMEAEAAKGHWDDVKHQYVMPESWEKLRKSSDYHPICRYGGWAAALAAQGPEFDHRKSTFPEGCCDPECKCHD